LIVCLSGYNDYSSYAGDKKHLKSFYYSLSEGLTGMTQRMRQEGTIHENLCVPEPDGTLLMPQQEFNQMPLSGVPPLSNIKFPAFGVDYTGCG
jgi:hypothetical protein